MKNRLVKHFGFEFDYLTNKIKSDKPIEAIPEECQTILKRLLHQKLIKEIPDQLTINYYSPGIKALNLLAIF
jgi:alkylated DNA repair protein alkB family protein 8